MSKMFDFISGKSRGKVAELEASIEHTAGYLGLELEENQRLRTALEGIIEWSVSHDDAKRRARNALRGGE